MPLLLLNLAQNSLSGLLVSRKPYHVPYLHCIENETVSEAVFLCASILQL
jgi:hypothetical protein